MFYREQPDLNWRNPEVRRELLDVFRFWLDKGVKGFRLDVFNLYFKDDEFRDNPTRLFRLSPDQRQKMIHNCDLPEMKNVLAEIRKLLDQYDEAYVVGETFLGSPEKAAGYCGDDALHQAFLFDFLECRWNPNCFSKVVSQWETALDQAKWPNYVLNNHDVVRSASRYGQGEDDERLKVAAAMLLTLRGTPFLYYGEEIGMREVKLSRSQILDPVGLRFWPVYKGRDGCRTPMQWNKEINAGFSSGSPWLPQNPDWLERNVENQEANPDSLLNFYRRLIALRRSESVLVQGSLELLKGMPSGMMAYRRALASRSAWIYLNFGEKNRRVAAPEVKMSRMFSNKREDMPADQTIELLGNEALILISA